MSAHADPGADPAAEWDRPKVAATAGEWRAAAELLRTLLDSSTAVRVADECDREADRMDRDAADAAFVRELELTLMDAYYRGTWDGVARAALAHLRPVAEWLIAEAAWKSATDNWAPLYVVTRGAWAIPDPGPWESVADIPADVDRVVDQDGDGWVRTRFGWTTNEVEILNGYAPFSRAEEES